MNLKEKMKALNEMGWYEYYDNSCYHQSWVDKGWAYDKAAAPIKDVYEKVIGQYDPKEQLKDEE